MPGIPLKSGADFCVLEAARMRLHNLGSDPNEYGAGLIYFNTSEGKNTSKRIRIYDGANFRSLAFLDEIANNEAFNALVTRVGVAEGDIDSLEGRTDALEALFSGSNAKVADNALMLGGQLPSYYAQSSVLAQLRSEFDALYKTLNDDTTGVIDTWQEVVDFVNEYSGSEDLSTILAGMNTQIADRYTKAEADGRFLKLTGGTISTDEGTNTPLVIKSQYNGIGWVGIAYENKDGRLGGLGFRADGTPLFVASNKVDSYTLLHSGNYSDLITTLNKTLSVPRVLVGTQGLRVNGNLNVPIEINGSNIKRYGRSGGYLLSDEYYGLTPTKLLVQVGVFATGDTLEHYCIGNRIESSAAGERWFSINAASSAFYVPTSFSSGITTNELTIDGIRLSVVDGKLKIEGDAFATGELSAGGAGEEGDEGMGLALLEDWAYYDATKAQALGAVLGKDMYDRIVTLEGRATKVGVIPTLTSGKKIGVIEVDGNSTSLFAPATYAWSEITSKPTTLAGYGITDALKTDGSNALKAGIDWNNAEVGVNVDNFGTGLIVGRTTASGTSLASYNYQYSSVLNISDGNYRFQIASPTDHRSRLVFRGYDANKDEWKDWKTIAFTDSDITGNAATATALKNAVNLWGNSFDGTQSLSGNITVRNNNGLLGTKSDTTTVTPLVILNNQNIFYLGTDDLYNNDISTRLYGKTIDFRTSGTAAMTITEEGNVLVGRSSNYFNARFTQSGLHHIEGGATSVAIGKAPVNGLTIGYDTLRVMAQWLNGTTGEGNIQVMSVDDSNKTYALNLNPFGGAVNIASADAYTNVLGHMELAKDLRMNALLMMNTGKEGIYLAASSINWHDSNNTYTDSLIRFAKDSVTVYPNLLASRVLIGGATDDGETDLQVKNTMSIADSPTSMGLRLNRSMISAWLPENYSFGHTATFGLRVGDALLGAYGHYRDSLGGYYAFVGISQDSPWFSINSAESRFDVLATFNSGIIIPTGQSFKIGEATLSWDGVNNALKVDKSIYSDGEVSAGGAGAEEEGTTTGGGREPWASEPFAVTSTSMTFNHNIGTEDVIVQVYERDATSGHWSLILVDVEIVDNASIALHFGRTETTLHKVIVMG